MAEYIERFDGTTDVLEWIETLENVQAANEATDRRMLGAAELRLEGRAKVYWNYEKGRLRTAPTLEDLKEILKRNYGQETSAQTQRTALQEKLARIETLEDLVPEVAHEMGRHKKVPLEDAVQIVLQMLPMELLLQVDATDTRDAKQVMEYLAKVRTGLKNTNRTIRLQKPGATSQLQERYNRREAWEPTRYTRRHSDDMELDLLQRSPPDYKGKGYGRPSYTGKQRYGSDERNYRTSPERQRSKREDSYEERRRPETQRPRDEQQRRRSYENSETSQSPVRQRTPPRETWKKSETSSTERYTTEPRRVATQSAPKDNSVQHPLLLQERLGTTTKTATPR
jgi:hypothetical protein